MKLADIVILRQTDTPRVNQGGCTLSASAELFSIPQEVLDKCPEIVEVVAEDGSCATVAIERLNYLRSMATVAQLLDMLEHSPVGVVAIDEKSRIFYANSSYTRILGIPRQRVLGRFMAELEPAAAILEVLSGKSPMQDKIVHIHS
ncbi:MAG: PAS domain-containing protein, partial [Deltaproteobacteria bacterium]|nr:PAS domain-containing protein [Deltaproteobacteria bacterium]